MALVEFLSKGLRSGQRATRGLDDGIDGLFGDLKGALLDRLRPRTPSDGGSFDAFADPTMQHDPIARQIGAGETMRRPPVLSQRRRFLKR